MTRFYAAIDEKAGVFCVMSGKTGKIITRCSSEAWSCAIQDALNMVDKLAEQASEMSTWPDAS